MELLPTAWSPKKTMRNFVQLRFVFDEVILICLIVIIMGALVEGRQGIKRLGK